MKFRGNGCKGVDGERGVDMMKTYHMYVCMNC